MSCNHLLGIVKITAILCLLSFVACASSPDHPRKIKLSDGKFQMDDLDPDSAEAMESIAVELAEKMTGLSISTIAILDFYTTDKEATTYGKLLSEDLIYYLSDMNICKIIERSLLDKVIEEQGLTIQDLFDHESVADLGNILGSEAVIFGTYTDTGKNIIINARLVSTKTAEILACAREVEKSTEDTTPPDDPIVPIKTDNLKLNTPLKDCIGIDGNNSNKYQVTIPIKGYIAVEVENINKKGKKTTVGKIQLLDSGRNDMAMIKWVKAGTTKKTDPIMASSGETFHIAINAYKDHRAQYIITAIWTQ